MDGIGRSLVRLVTRLITNYGVLMRVLLVEPHPIVRQGLITVLQSLFTELELLEADSAEHALVLLNKIGRAHV